VVIGLAFGWIRMMDWKIIVVGYHTAGLKVFSALEQVAFPGAFALPDHWDSLNIYLT
jgi:hypothetical protein